jgi:hypothetical protein
MIFYEIAAFDPNDIAAITSDVRGPSIVTGRTSLSDPYPTVA